MIQSINLTNPLDIAVCTDQAVGAGADVTLYYNVTDPEKNLLDERDEIKFSIKSLLNNIPAGSTITATYYGRDAVGVLGTETITLPEITKDVMPTTLYGFYSEYTKQAKYFTLAILLKKGTAYTVSIDCLVKKKSSLEEDMIRFSGTENGLLFVDGNRLDSYVEDGSSLFPFKTISALITALNTDYAALSNKQLSTYDITVAKGSYSLTGLVIPTYKYLRFRGVGVTFTGNFAITQSPIGGSGEEPYTRIEFVGIDGFRGEKGQAFQISGNVTCTRTNDSLTYLAFAGCRVSGNWLFDSDGTWVLQADHNRFSGTISSGTFTDPESAVLIESDAFSRFSGVINIKGCLYRCNNTEFSANVTCDSNFTAMDANASYMPYRITNCIFNNTANSFIGNQNLLIDSSSYKSLKATTETIAFTGVGGLVITDPANSIQVATPVNAVAASGTMQVVARPASYVKNVQAYSTLTSAEVPDDGKIVTIDGAAVDKEIYTFKETLTVPAVDFEVLIDGAASWFNFVDVVNALSTKCTASNSGGDAYVLTFKSTAYLGATGNTKTLTSDVANTTIAAPAPGSAANQFGGGVAEVSNYRTVGLKNYIFTTTGDGTDPVTDLGASFVRVDSAALATPSDVGLALRTAVDTDPLWVVTGSGAYCTVTALVKGEGESGLGTGNFAPFVNNCETAGEVLPLNTTTTLMSGGINGTPGYKGMVYYDATTNETWKTSEENYTVTQSGWYNTANSASIFLKQDKALVTTAPVTETRAKYAIQSCLLLGAKALGTLGNFISVKATASADDVLRIAVTGTGTILDPYLIDIQLANTTGSKNTSALISAAIVAAAPSNALVFTNAYVPATQITAFTVQSLVGGVNGTIGYLGQVIYAADGTRYEMKYTTADCYYWNTDDVIVSANTEYFVRYDARLGKTVWRQYRDITTAASGGSIALNFQILGLSTVENIHTIAPSGVLGTIVGNFYNSSTPEWMHHTYTGGNVYLVTSNAAGINSRVVKVYFTYSRS